jgi:ABC-type lipoprotein release transport system permease subunit
VGGTETQLLGFRSLLGGIGPTVVDGRAPQAPDEVVLGSDTMERLDVSIGERVPFAGADGAPVDLEVVGRGVFATSSDTLDEGAALTMEGLELLDAYVGTTELLVRWEEGTDEEAGLAALTEVSGSRPIERIQPSQVRDLSRVQSLPVALAAFLALLAATAVGHALVTGVRRRRRDLAVLRSVGFVGRQVAATVAWQSTTLALVGLAIGLPLGVALGRWTWSLVARQIGVVVRPDVPLPAIALACVGAVVVANAVAALPARQARQLRPATALRTE